MISERTRQQMKYIGKYADILIPLIVMFFVCVYVIQWAWNCFMYPVLGFREITYWQSCAALVLLMFVINLINMILFPRNQK